MNRGRWLLFTHQVVEAVDVCQVKCSPECRRQVWPPSISASPSPIRIYLDLKQPCRDESLLMTGQLGPPRRPDKHWSWCQLYRQLFLTVSLRTWMFGHTHLSPGRFHTHTHTQRCLTLVRPWRSTEHALWQRPTLDLDFGLSLTRHNHGYPNNIYFTNGMDKLHWFSLIFPVYSRRQMGKCNPQITPGDWCPLRGSNGNNTVVQISSAVGNRKWQWRGEVAPGRRTSA